MRPHIVIYLDVPVKGVQERIKKRNLSHEVKGKALTDKYLNDLEHVYKREYLPMAEYVFLHFFFNFTLLIYTIF